MKEDWKNKVAYVTGGTKGIGLAIVTALHDLGMKVCYTGSSEESVLSATEYLPTSEHLLG